MEILNHGRFKWKRIEAFWHRNARWLWWLPLALVGVPLSIAARFTCPVPKADHWFVVTLPYLGYVNGGSWWDFIHSPGNDSRHDVPKLLHHLLIRLTGWNLTMESMTCVVITLAACGMVLAWWRQHPGSSFRNWLLGGLSVFLLLSPMQWMNWNWGIQICYAMVVTGTVGMIMAFHTRWPLAARSLGGAICAMAAAMSFINGWFAWIMGLVLLLVACHERQWRWKETVPALAVWVSGFALTLGWFRSGWPEQIAGNHSGLLQKAMRHPLEDLHYAMQLIGAPFSQFWPISDRELRNAHQIAASPWVAAFTLFLLAAILQQFRKQKPSWKQASPWICLLLWGLANAAAIGVGRTDIQISSPFQSRYPAFVLWYHLGLLGLLFMLQGRLAAWWKGLYILILVWGGGVGALQGWEAAERDGIRNHFIAAAAALRHAAVEPVWLDAVYPGGGERIIPALDQLENLGLLNVTTIRSERVAESAMVPDSSWDGRIEKGNFESNGVFLRGWAFNRETRDAARVVALSFRAAGGPERWLGFATHKLPLKKLAAKLDSRAFENRIGWAYEPLTGKETTAFSQLPLTFTRPSLPDGTLTFRAYVFDAVKGVFHPLQGEVVLEQPAGPAE